MGRKDIISAGGARAAFRGVAEKRPARIRRLGSPVARDSAGELKETAVSRIV
jgi:hypothetical protein